MKAISGDVNCRKGFLVTYWNILSHELLNWNLWIFVLFVCQVGHHIIKFLVIPWILNCSLGDPRMWLRAKLNLKLKKNNTSFWRQLLNLMEYIYFYFFCFFYFLMSLNSFFSKNFLNFHQCLNHSWNFKKKMPESIVHVVRKWFLSLATNHFVKVDT